MPDPTESEKGLPPGLYAAAARFLGTVDATTPVGSAPHLLRATAGVRDIVVREWPAGIARERVLLAVRAQRLAHAAGAPVPDPIEAPGERESWVVSVDGRDYTAANWIPGQPLARYGDFRTPDGEVIDVPLPASAPAEAVILAAAQVIGQVHAAAGSLVPETAHVSLARMLATTDQAWSDQRRVVGRAAGAFPEIRRWLRCGNRVIPTAGELIRQGADAGVRPVVIHGDLWPANLLVAGAGDERRLTGIVGWSSVLVGSALVDLAHLVTHGSGWSSARAESVLGAYTEAAPLSPIERRLLPVVAALDLLPRVGRLLHLAFVDDRMLGTEALPVLRSGLRSLLTSLENLTNALAPEAEWGQRKAGETRRDRGGGPVRTPRAPRTRPRRPPGSGRSRPR